MKKLQSKFLFGTSLHCALCLFILTGLIAGGCSRKIYVPVESERVLTDTVFQTRWRTDTVINSDTVKIMQRGDTVLLSSVKWRTRYRVLADTVYRSRTDSVYIEKPVPVVKEVVKNRLNIWQKLLVWCGAFSLISVFVYIAERFRKFL